MEGVPSPQQPLVLFAFSASLTILTGFNLHICVTLQHTTIYDQFLKDLQYSVNTVSCSARVMLCRLMAIITLIHSIARKGHMFLLLAGVGRWKQTQALLAVEWLLSTAPQGRCQTEARWRSCLWSSWTALAELIMACEKQSQCCDLFA